ncbi:MAG: NAD(P)-dependent oxidoreductase [Burkholderiaceae bacterium]
MIRKALVIGGSGFIGKPICKALAKRGVNVTTYDLSYVEEAGYSHRRGSITDPVSLDAAMRGTDYVFHIAGVLGTSELIEQSALAVDVNVAGTVHVLDACVKNRVKTVFYPTKPNTWLNTYSITKRAGEEFCAMYAREHRLDVRILRWLNAYGPGQKAFPVRKAVPVMILQALENRDLQIWGSGEQPVDLIHVEDLARITVDYTLSAHQDVTTRDTGLSYRMTVNDMAAFIIKLTGSSSRIAHLPMRKGEDQDIPVELLRKPYAADLLPDGGGPVSLESGMSETIAYYAKIDSARRRDILDFYYA